MTEKENLLDQAITQLLDLGFGDLDEVDILDSLVSNKVMAIGTTIDELFFTQLSIKELIQRQKEQSSGMNMHFSQSELFRHISPTGNTALIVTDLRVFFVINGEKLEVYVRFSTVFEWLDDGWRIVHFHASKPENVESEKDTFGIEEWKQKTIELEKLVSERTAELVMKNQELNSTISQLKSTQAQLIHSEKMASLGALTAGIAHEIQNPLNFVNNFSEVNAELITELTDAVSKGNLAEVQSLAKDIKENEEKIVHHGKRADLIVKSMLQHSRSSSGQKEVTDINILADEYLRLSYHGMRAKDKSFNADFKTDLDPTLPKISVVPQDIGRVLLNLINNAFYACMERQNGGKAERQNSADQPEARSQAPEAYQPIVTVGTKNLGDKIEISIKDNGNGIPRHVLDKIFQPFFTTKPTGQGTGLGLSLAYDIVTKGHGGQLDVSTDMNVGTQFIIKLPVS